MVSITNKMMRIRLDITLIVTLTLCSAIYAAIAILYTQINGVQENYDVNNMEFIDVSFYMYNRGLCIRYCSILVWNLIQAAYIFYPKLWTWCQTVFLRIGCFALNIVYAIDAVQTYKRCDWKSLPYVGAPGSSEDPVCTLYSECSKLPIIGTDYTFCSYEYIDNAKLLIPVTVLLSVAALVEIVFLALYRKHISKNVILPKCCRLTTIDSVTEDNSVIVVDTNEKSGSDQPVAQINRSVRNPNFEGDPTNES